MKAPAHRKVVGAKEDSTGTPAQALGSANSRTPHIHYPEFDDSTTTYQKAGKGVSIKGDNHERLDFTFC